MWPQGGTVPHTPIKTPLLPQEGTLGLRYPQSIQLHSEDANAVSVHLSQTGKLEPLQTPFV